MFIDIYAKWEPNIMLITSQLIKLQNHHELFKERSLYYKGRMDFLAACLQAQSRTHSSSFWNNDIFTVLKKKQLLISGKYHFLEILV